MPLLAAFLLGVIAGLRSMTPLAAVSLAARAGRLALANTFLAFLQHPASSWVFCLFALGELIADKLPFTPSRKQPFSFAVRIVSGAIAGSAVGVSAGMLVGGALLGMTGAVAGTLGGFSFRAKLARALGNDLPAALIEDAIAVGSAIAVYSLLRATAA